MEVNCLILTSYLSIHKIHKASVSPLILTVLPLSFILLVQCPLSSLRVRPRSISSSVGSHIRHLTGLYNFLYPKPTTPGQQLHGPPPQPCAINLSSSIRLADAPTTPMLLIAAQHTAAQAILSSSERSSLVTYALHTRVMVLSMHHHIATQTVATTVATRAQRAINERFCLRQWDLALQD